MDFTDKKVGDVVEIDGQKKVVLAVGNGAVSFGPYVPVVKKGVESIIEGLEEVEAPKKKRGR